MLNEEEKKIRLGQKQRGWFKIATDIWGFHRNHNETWIIDDDESSSSSGAVMFPDMERTWLCRRSCGKGPYFWTKGWTEIAVSLIRFQQTEELASLFQIGVGTQVHLYYTECVVMFAQVFLGATSRQKIYTAVEIEIELSVYVTVYYMEKSSNISFIRIGFMVCLFLFALTHLDGRTVVRRAHCQPASSGVPRNERLLYSGDARNLRGPYCSCTPLIDLMNSPDKGFWFDWIRSASPIKD